MAERVLIIDDEEHIRRMMRLTLEAAGYEVSEAADGTDGINSFGDGSSWSVVILDQRMPGIDGLEVLRHLKVLDPQARIVMATAYASIELAVDAMKLGATDFVRKPMTPEVLRNAVASAISRVSSQAASLSAANRQSNEHSFEIVTMNGFTIVDSDGGSPEPYQRRFIVQTPGHTNHEVVVQINEEAVAYVERMTRRSLPAGNSFWTIMAQRTLSNYLWQEGKVPPLRRLTLDDVPLEELPVAERWERPWTTNA